MESYTKETLEFIGIRDELRERGLPLRVGRAQREEHAKGRLLERIEETLKAVTP